MDLLSPYAPLWPWLKSALDAAPVFLAGGPAHLGTGPLGDTETVYCRPLAVRVQVLATLDAHGHRFPWALGSIWSPLTDDQAGRLTAEIVRRVGPDPKAPAQVLPNGVLGPVIRHEGAGLYSGVYQEYRRELVGSPYCTSSEGGKRQRGYPGPRGWSCGPHQGQETGDLGRAMAERRAMDLGAILVEQITPKG